jgi:microcystin-dependent protein
MAFDRIGTNNTEFNKAHTNADTDLDEAAIHHTLGLGRYQAAPGIALKELHELVDIISAQALELIGEVKFWILDDAPPHFLACHGQSLSTTDYADLFAVIGYKYGGAGGSFSLPDARHRFLVGADGDAGASDGWGLSLREFVNTHRHLHVVAVDDADGQNTSVDGGHDHTTGGPSATNTPQSGSGANTATDSHTHDISFNGHHQHTTDGHTHTAITENTSIGHAYIYLTLVIRYESGIDV